MQATAFLPSRDGFSFRNDFEYPASRVGRAAALAQGYGLAGGMCLSALDRWLSGRPLPQLPTPPQPGDPLYEEFVRRQIELLGRGAWDRILDWQSRPGLGHVMGASGVGELTRGEWRRLRRSLDAGRPAVLCVLRTRGPFANPSENPIVLAIRYEFARATRRGTVWLYDPNRPGNDDVRLTVSIAGRRRTPETTFISERVRGFIVLPYDRTAVAPLRAIEIADQTDAGMAGRPVVMRGRGVLAAVRGRNGSLIVVCRKPTRAGDGDLELRRIPTEIPLVSDPVVPSGDGSPILARDAKGHVIAFSRGVGGWKSRVLPGPKNNMQVDYGPAAVSSRGRVHVFGVRSGKLVHFVRGRAGTWTVAEIAAQATPGGGDRLDGHPAACVSRDHTVHVFVRTEKGRIAHLRLGEAGAWTAALLPAADAPIAGDPVVAIAPAEEHITVLAVTDAGELVQIRGTGSDAWRARNLTRETGTEGGPHLMRVEIAVSDGPGSTLHVFGVSPRNGLVHYWCPPTLAWRAQDLTDGRADIGALARVRGKPSISRAPDDQLIVAASGEKGIVVYRWSASSDWTGDVLPTPPAIADTPSAGGPVVWSDARGATHLLAVFDDGRAVLAAPGRPESSHRALRPAVASARADAGTAHRASSRSMPQPNAAPVIEAPLQGETARYEVEDFEAPAPIAFGNATPSLAQSEVEIDASSSLSTPTVEPGLALEPGAIAPGDVDKLDVGEFGGVGDFEPFDAGLSGFTAEPVFGLTPGLEDPLTPNQQPGEGTLLDFGLHAMTGTEATAPETTPSADLGGVTPLDLTPSSESTPSTIEREGWGSYGEARSEPTVPASGDLDIGHMSFEPAEPLLPNTGSTEFADIELSVDPTFASSGAAPEAKAKAVAEGQAKAEAERAAAEAAAQVEAKRVEAQAAAKAKAERAAAEAAAKAKAERTAAEAAKKKAEARAAAKAEQERVAAEAAKKKAEARAAAKAKEERVAAEAAKKKAEARAAKGEAERIAAEAAAKETAERLAAQAATKAAAQKAAAQKAAAEKVAAQKAAAEKAAADRTAAAEAQRAAEHKAAQPGGKKGTLSPALEGLPLLDENAPPVGAQAPKSEPEPEPKKPEDAKETPKPPRPKLRSVDDLIRLSDEHGPTFDKK